MNRLVLLIVITMVYVNGYGQFIVKDTMPASMKWSYHFIDLPYMTDAAKTEAIRAADGSAPFTGKTEFNHYGKFYRNLSMNQATDMAHNLHGTLYYGHNVLWNSILKPTNTKNYILNRLFANITALGTDYLAIKLPYGYAFQHEEFHRSVMTTRHIYSYDEVWNFGKGLDIAVTRVKDEDLVYLKGNHPADQVRLSAAGVEGEYRFMQRMRDDNFFNKTGFPMVGLSILGTLHAVNYVKLPFAERFDAITDSILIRDKQDILARDFTGYDFSAWVYDLFTPNEPYDSRGTWPDGVGIKRPVKASQLTPEMKEFLSETGNLQYLNFVSPFLIGINRLQLKPGHYFNFALRSVPTSFGYFAGGDFYLDFKNRQMMISVGVNRSKELTLPAIELRHKNILKNTTGKFNTDVQLSGWFQPKDQLFASENSEAGFLIGLQPRFSVTKHLEIISDVSYKTKGWVFGNPYLDDKLNLQFGISIKTSKASS